MATLIKQTTTHHVDAGGKRVPAGTPGAVRVSVVSKKWYATGVPGWPKGKRVPLAADRRAAEKMLADLVARAERGIAGVDAPRDQPLAPLIEEFHESLKRKASDKHARDVVRDVRLVLSACRLTTLMDLLAADVPVRAEAAVWGLCDGGKMTPANAAYIGKHARQFTRWLWRKRKVLDHDPLSGIDLPSQKTVNKRRALTDAELASLLAAAMKSEWVFRGLTGADRAALYVVAVTTGFRVEELSRVGSEHVNLSAAVPHVFLPGRFTKNGEDAVQPLSAAAVQSIRPLLARRSGLLWPGTWHERAARMIRHDLTDAGVAHATPEGKADFHALRHTFTTMLGRTAPLKVVQELARHSTPILTVGRYSHAGMAEKVSAVDSLPVGGDPELTRDQLAAACGLFATLFATLFAPETRADANSCEQFAPVGNEKTTPKGGRK